MGKKERERKQKARQQRAYGTPRFTGRVGISEASEQDVLRVFGLEDCVPLTAEIIESLVAQGWLEKKLLECQQQQGQYCAPRDSIIFAEPEGTELVRDGDAFLVHQHQLAFQRP